MRRNPEFPDPKEQITEPAQHDVEVDHKVLVWRRQTPAMVEAYHGRKMLQSDPTLCTFVHVQQKLGNEAPTEHILRVTPWLLS